MKYPELFDICAGLTASKLYKHFPHDTSIDFSNLYTEIAQDFPDIPPEEHVKIFLIIHQTFSWLAETDFIVFENLSETQVTNTHLSDRGLMTLNIIPDDLDTNNEPLGEFLSDALQSGKKDTLLKGVNCMLKAAA